MVDLKPLQGIRTRARRKRGFSVNRSLTPRTPRETADVAAGVGRMIRGLSRRAEAGDLQVVAALRSLDQQLAQELLRAIHGLHVQHGYSWAEIGLAAGITRQAAQKRWGA